MANGHLMKCMRLHSPSPDGRTVTVSLFRKGMVLPQFYSGEGPCKNIVHTVSVALDRQCTNWNVHTDDDALSQQCRAVEGGDRKEENGQEEESGYMDTMEYRRCFWTLANVKARGRLKTNDASDGQAVRVQLFRVRDCVDEIKQGYLTIGESVSAAAAATVAGGDDGMNNSNTTEEERKEKRQGRTEPKTLAMEEEHSDDKVNVESKDDADSDSGHDDNDDNADDDDEGNTQQRSAAVQPIPDSGQSLARCLFVTLEARDATTSTTRLHIGIFRDWTVLPDHYRGAGRCKRIVHADGVRMNDGQCMWFELHPRDRELYSTCKRKHARASQMFRMCFWTRENVRRGRTVEINEEGKNGREMGSELDRGGRVFVELFDDTECEKRIDKGVLTVY